MAFTAFDILKKKSICFILRLYAAVQISVEKQIAQISDEKQRAHISVGKQIAHICVEKQIALISDEKQIAESSVEKQMYAQIYVQKKNSGNVC